MFLFLLGDWLNICCAFFDKMFTLLSFTRYRFSTLTNTSAKNIEEKIAKLDALIASTTNQGEKESAILARERLLKKLKKHVKHTKTKKKKKAAKASTSNKEEKEEIDPFFFRADNSLRESKDTSKASFYQKRFLCNLVERAQLACPSTFLKKYVNSLGLEQANRNINNLIEIVGDPREKPATPRQVAFLKRNPRIEITEEMIEVLKSREASKIIGAIMELQKVESFVKSSEMIRLKSFLEED